MAERKRALQSYRRDGSDTLFEMVIDPEGKVRKCRILKTHIEDDYRRIVKRHGRDLLFRPEPETTLYRAFFFPTRYIHTKEFEKQ